MAYGFTGGASGGSPYGSTYQQQNNYQQPSYAPQYGGTPRAPQPVGGTSQYGQFAPQYGTNPVRPTGYTGAYNTQYAPQRTGQTIGSGGYQTPSWGYNRGAYGGVTMSDYQGPPGGGPPSNPGTTWDNYPQQGGGQSSGGGSGMPTPNPDPYNHPEYDYINPDGTPHVNPQYGQGGGGGGGQQAPGGGLGRDGELPATQPGTSGPGAARDDYRGNPPPGATPPPGTPGAVPGQYALTWAQYAAMPPEQRAAYDAYNAGQVPYQQLQYNQGNTQQQYGEDVRRWDLNYNSQQQQQQYENVNTDRQMQLAEWQQKYNELSGNRNYDLEAQMAGHTREMDQQNLDLQRLQNQQQYGLALDNQQLQDYVQRSGVANTSRMTTAQIQDMLAQQELGRGNLALGQGRLASDTQQWQGAQQLQGQGLVNEMLRWQGDSALQGELGRGNLANDTRRISNDYQLGQGRLASDTQQWQGAQRLQGRSIDNDLFLGRGQLENQRSGIANEMTRWRGDNALATELGRGNLANETQSIRNQFALGQGDLDVRRQGQSQDYELGRGNLALQGELGRGNLAVQQQQANQDFQIRQGQLNQQADQFAKQLGLDTEQVRNTRWYQEQQAGIERERLAQTGQLGNRGLDVEEYTAHQNVLAEQARRAQEAVLAREQMGSQERMNLMSTFGRLQAPQSRVIRNF